MITVLIGPLLICNFAQINLLIKEPSPGTVNLSATRGTYYAVGSVFSITTSGIYRVLVDMNLPPGYILCIDNGGNGNSVFYSNSITRTYGQYFVYLTVGSHQTYLYNDNAGANNTAGPYFAISIEGPIN